METSLKWIWISSKGRFDFVILHNHDIEEDIVGTLIDKLAIITTENALLFYVGDEKSLDVLKKNSKFKNVEEYFDVIDAEIQKAEFPFREENFTVFQKGYDTFEILLEEQTNTISESLEEGEAITATSESIRAIRKKDDIEILFKACNCHEKFVANSTLRDMKEILIAELGLEKDEE